MHIMKFGGTSLGNAARIAATCALVSERARTSRVGLVVSALSGVTNFLVECKDAALAGRDFAPLVARFREHHLGEIEALAREFPALDAALPRRFVLGQRDAAALCGSRRAGARAGPAGSGGVLGHGLHRGLRSLGLRAWL